MIKVGILGAESSVAGELIRILLHHQDVELTTAYAPTLRGRALSSIHRGIIGDTDLRFTDTVDLSDLDVVFLTSPQKYISHTELPDDLRVIVIQEDDNFQVEPPFDTLEYVPGVSEMFRKPLVRGAKASRILPAATTLALIALFPLALHLLLNDQLRLKVCLPQFKADGFSGEDMTRELETLLHQVQLSFNRIQGVELEISETLRALSVEIELPCSVSEEEIERIYDSIYDDHNFTFMMRTDPSPAEVAGTHKCLLYISKPEENILRVKAVADSVLRGGAGDAIHAMNLLFGLFEKIGLSLPAGLAFKP